MNKIVLFLLILSFSTVVTAKTNYADQRLRADMDPKTMKIRRDFRSFIKTKFTEIKNKNELKYLQFSFNDRMIAQYGRGSKSAFSELPKDLARAVSFIRSAQRNKRALLKDLSTNYQTLKKYNDEEILRAIHILAGTKKLHLDYWGYLSSYKAPSMELKSRTLSFYAKWIEGESHYVATHEKQLRSNIIRGIIKNLNYTPWFKDLFN